MKPNQNQPRAAGDAAHTPASLLFPFELETGPTVHFAEAEVCSAPEPGGSRRIIFKGSLEECVFVLRACNSHAPNLATIESAARDLEMVADMIETGPAPKPETLRELAKAYRVALALAKGGAS